MIIANNMAAMTVLSETNRQVRGANQASRELSLGQRVTGAEDDASTYSISEKMQTKVKALDQAKANSANGQSLLDTASQAVDQQVNILKLVKTIALKATDDTYSDSDRKILQKEVSQMLDQSEQIATTTDFNGVQLLDQSYFSKVDYTFNADAPYHVNPNNEPVIAQAATQNYTVPQGTYDDVDNYAPFLYDPTNIGPGNGLTADPAVGDFVWVKATGTVARVYADPNGGTDLYAGDPQNGGVVIVPDPSNLGANSNAAEIILPLASQPYTPGSYLATTSIPKFDASGNNITPKYEVKIEPGTGATSLFKPDGTTSITEFDLSALAALVPGTISSPADLNGLGFSLNCGGCDQFVTVMFNKDSAGTKKYEGSTGNPAPLCYYVGVSGVDFTNPTDFQKSLGEIVFNGISSANGASKSLPYTKNISTTIADRHSIELNYIASTGKLTISKDGPTITLMNGIMGALEEHDFYKPEQLLALQTSDTSGQFNKIKLPNTTLAVLYPVNGDRWDIEPTEEDYPDPWPNDYHSLSDAEKIAKFKQEIWQYAVKGSSIDLDNCVTTREKANDFLDRTDQAIKYLLNANTTLGAQYSRLDYTQDNLTTETENITAAESVLRDADMAKSATKLAKSNLLAQAAQSMLAQANQLPNKALEMLQG